ncbi:MAG: hypothetical protein H3C62_05195 [Gemmatimonadaceae bacterium]|nr:hypothetical protein [Gemmatimonadaceae bacterium]
MTASQLLRAVMQVDQMSLHAPWNARVELHLVRRVGRTLVGRPEAEADACACLPRVAAAPDTFFRDRTPDEYPMGDALCALPVDALSTDEVLRLLARGWQRTRVRAVWMGAATRALLADHDHRAARVARRAGHQMWTYYRSTGWGFLYRLPKQP